VACVVSHARAATLAANGITVSQPAGLDRVSIRLDSKVDVRVVDAVKEKGFFFVDFYATAAAFPDRVFQLAGGVLKAYETRSYPENRVLRVIFHPNGEPPFRVKDEVTGVAFRVSSLADAEFAPSAPKTASIVVETGKIPPELQPATGPKRFVILDPGHGGKDPGAMSRFTVGKARLREKDLTLAVAKAVQAELNQMPGIEAILTRSTDVRTPLKEIVDFAERTGGDLFVSIHMNATKYHPRGASVRGVELYYLSKVATPDVSALVEGENLENGNGASLDPAASAQLAQIMKSLAQDCLEENRALGAKACEAIRRALSTDPYYKTHIRWIRGAPFRVLGNLIMPAILVEVGYIDNPQEAANLANPAFQKKAAKLLAMGIQQYLSQQKAATAKPAGR
jgi:N-acetylmuramoyl-L-alanine amidase